MPELQNRTSVPRRAKTQKSGVVVPHAPKWHQRLVAALIYARGARLTATLRFRLEDLSGYFSDVPQEKIIFAIWHNRLALALILYRRYVARRDRKRRLVALVSASRDGGLLAGILELFKVQPVRGSSSRRGAQAFREMVSWGRRGHDLAITPDGPRGPCYVVQEGVISTAQMTGMPIVPVDVSSQLENPREELGPVSNSAAVRALHGDNRQSRCACRAKRTRPAAKNCGCNWKRHCAAITRD